MRIIGLLFAALFVMAMDWKPTTKAEAEEDVKEVLSNCAAQHLLAIEVDDSREGLRIKISAIKDPHARTASDITAIRCVASHSTKAIDFRKLETQLLTMKKPNAQTH